MSNPALPGAEGIWLLMALELDISSASAADSLLWSRNQADQLASHLAVDIQQHLPGAERLLLTTSGALYDLCQLLRPGFPLLEALNRLRQAHVSQRGFSPQLLTVGSVQGSWPAPELKPDPDLPPGPMRYLPIHLSGPEELTGPLAKKAEADLLDTAQVSPHTASWLQGTAGLAVRHAHLMTFDDLLALWQMQLDSIGLKPFWALVDNCLFADEDSTPLSITGPQGITMVARGHEVDIEFQTLDQFARLTDLDADTCVQRYLAWTGSLRQYLAGLAAHAIPTTFHNPELQFEPGFALEPVSADPSVQDVTDFLDPDHGLIATAVRSPLEPANLYPLDASGPNAIRDWVSNRYEQAGLSPPEARRAQPGLDENRRIAVRTDNDVRP